VNTAAKGVKGEREVAALFEQAGFDVRGLESSGDWLVVDAGGHALHVEVKRHERPRWGEWVKQAVTDSRGLAWIVASRRNHGPWLAMQTLEHVVAREARIAELEAAASVVH
jgi:Holliday junction resolvase